MATAYVGLDLHTSYLLELVGTVVLGKTIRQVREQTLSLIAALPSPAPLDEGTGRIVDTSA